MAWTPERIKHLKKACQQGKTLTAIAKEMGVSRTTVTEKIKALNIVIKDNKKAAPKAAPVPAPVDPEKGLSLLELKYNSCRWPIKHTAGEGIRFCGATALLGKSYCAKHYAVAYINLKDKNKKNWTELDDEAEIPEKAPKSKEAVKAPVKVSATTKAEKEKTTGKAAVKAGAKTVAKPAEKPVIRPATTPTVKGAKPVEKAAPKVATKPMEKPAEKATAKTVKPAAKPATKTTKSAVKQSAKPIKTVKPAVKAEKAPVSSKSGVSKMSRFFSKLTGKK